MNMQTGLEIYWSITGTEFVSRIVYFRKRGTSRDIVGNVESCEFGSGYDSIDDGFYRVNMRMPSQHRMHLPRCEQAPYR